MSLLTGQTAVVTGGAQGLGFAIAERFIAEGARVVLGDLDLGATEAAAKQLGGDDVALAVRCDVTQADEVDALVAAAVERFGGLDIMVNNAGITRDATMRKMTEEQFDQVIAVHLKGTWNGIRKAARDHAREQARRHREHVVDVGQGRPRRADELLGGQGRHRRHDQGRGQGARPPRACGSTPSQPGLIRSAMTEAMPQHIWDQKVAEVPMGRAGEPVEVAKVALFLASDLSSYMTGTVMEVTGGRFM